MKYLEPQGLRRKRSSKVYSSRIMHILRSLETFELATKNSYGDQMLTFTKTLCPSGLRGWTQVPLARAAWAQIPQVSISAPTASIHNCIEKIKSSDLESDALPLRHTPDFTETRLLLCRESRPPSIFQLILPKNCTRQRDRVVKVMD